MLKTLRITNEFHARVPKYLYRYFGHPERDIETLANGFVYFSHPTQLNDPFDCQLCFNTDLDDFHESEIPALMAYLALSAQLISGKTLRFSTDPDTPLQRRFDLLCEDYLSCILNFGVHSMSECRDHPLLWSHYGNAFKGFMVKYDTSSPEFHDVLNYTFPIKYVDEIPKINFKEFIESEIYASDVCRTLLTTKGAAWDYEREWRVITSPGQRQETLPFPVAEVVFGCYLNDVYRSALMKIFGDQANYLVAAPDENSFSVGFHPIKDGRSRIPSLARPFRSRGTYFFNKPRA